MREAIIRGGARAYYNLMSPTERDSVDRILRFIERNPPPDETTIFEAPDFPGLRVFDNGMWRIGYQDADDAAVVVFALRHVLDLSS